MKIKGLRKICGETKKLAGYYSGEYLELFYDHSSGEAWTVYQFGFGQNTWTKYHDKDIIKIANISEPMTMQDIASLICDKVTEYEARIAWEAEIERQYRQEITSD